MKRARQKDGSPKLFVHLKPNKTPQPVNPNHWSESSKRSVIFTIPPALYEDIHYHCIRCGKSAVFTAVDQKVMFESRKAYIWQRRILCQDCYHERRQIERDIRQCQSRWRNHKGELRRDLEFLRRWLGLLERHPEYGGRTNHAGITMLRRLVGEPARTIKGSAEVKDETSDRPPG